MSSCPKKKLALISNNSSFRVNWHRKFQTLSWVDVSLSNFLHFFLVEARRRHLSGSRHSFKMLVMFWNCLFACFRCSFHMLPSASFRLTFLPLSLSLFLFLYFFNLLVALTFLIIFAEKMFNLWLLVQFGYRWREATATVKRQSEPTFLSFRLIRNCQLLGTKRAKSLGVWIIWNSPRCSSIFSAKLSEGRWDASPLPSAEVRSITRCSSQITPAVVECF